MCWDVTCFFRNKDDHKGHNTQVRIQGPHFIKNFLVRVVRWLNDLKAFFKGIFLDHINRLTFFIWCAIDGNNIVAPIHHCLKAPSEAPVIPAHRANPGR